MRKFSPTLWISSKTWAMIMALKNLALGICIIIGGSIWLSSNEVLDTFKTYFACGVFIGIINIFAGIILITALIQGKENIVLLYLLIEFVILFTLTIFTAMNNLDFENFSPTFLIAFLLCISLWIGHYNVYLFYLELQKYNNSSVQAGVEEIACNTHPNPMESFPEKSLDTTTV
ncbi:uncharacterized protein LOC126741187 [Anthonomus grandis grandis]|uniref:uncharacterized protein LOC126741187 n=1 Tax=Anthonomus grandis grandis TaxID=2921223 RepID=UPI00216538B4|nr:uncharacterized protein LOC126741187 [Anthonomus grandis grandis]